MVHPVIQSVNTPMKTRHLQHNVRLRSKVHSSTQLWPITSNVFLVLPCITASDASSKNRPKIIVFRSAYRTLKLVFHGFPGPFLRIFLNIPGPFMSIFHVFPDCLITLISNKPDFHVHFLNYTIKCKANKFQQVLTDNCKYTEYTVIVKGQLQWNFFYCRISLDFVFIFQIYMSNFLPKQLLVKKQLWW